MSDEPNRKTFTLNPCRVCGAIPYDAYPVTSGRTSVFCYRDLNTHAVCAYGSTIDAARAQWNRMNPPPPTPEPRSRRTFLARLRAAVAEARHG